MNDMLPDPQNDRQLWQRYSEAVNTAASKGVEIDTNTLAAYVDGTADDREVAMVEQAAVADDRLLDQILTLRGETSNPLHLSAQHQRVPPGVRQRAVALVSTARHRSRLPWTNTIQWASAAVVVMSVAVGGYTTGRDTVRHQEQSASTLVSAAADTLNPVDDQQPMLLLAIAAGGAQ